MKKAVIDLGTNTFNLLIAELHGSQLQIEVNERIPVKLGKGGIHKNEIAPDAFLRGIDALNSFKKVIDSKQIKDVFAFGTSALRNAENASLFLQQVKSETGIDITIIDGNEEASLIYLGVKNAIPLTQTSLILDIGGGSNEFILCNEYEIFWKQSFELGIARLLERFKPSDPINLTQVKHFKTEIKQELKPLWEAVQKYPTSRLIGAAGTFDTYVNMLLPKTTNTSDELPLKLFNPLAEKLIFSSQAEKDKMEKLPAFRSEMISISTLFTQLILEELHIKHLFHSSYALKEGAFFT